VVVGGWSHSFLYVNEMEPSVSTQQPPLRMKSGYSYFFPYFQPAIRPLVLPELIKCGQVFYQVGVRAAVFNRLMLFHEPTFNEHLS